MDKVWKLKLICYTSYNYNTLNTGQTILTNSLTNIE